MRAMRFLKKSIGSAHASRNTFSVWPGETESIRKESKRIVCEEYDIAYADEPAWEIIGPGINNYNRKHAGDNSYQSLCFVLRAPDQQVVGGVIGATYWDWFYLDLLWVKEELRGRGHGHRLLTIAEQEARQRGAKNAYLDTFSFQAPDFYERHGYRVFGELQDFPPGHQRFFLTKQL